MNLPWMTTISNKWEQEVLFNMPFSAHTKHTAFNFFFSDSIKFNIALTDYIVKIIFDQVPHTVILVF
jgi:hypothetical protein